jgi:uncharacterized membrane protein
VNQSLRRPQAIPSRLRGLLAQCRRFFLARWTVLVLILLLLLAVALAAFVPQRADVPPEAMTAWRRQHVAWWVAMVDLGALDRVYTSPWFLALLLFLLVSLSLSLAVQGEAAWRRTFGPGAAATGGGVPIPVAGPRLDAILRHHGFYRLSADGGGSRFVKHPWGLWGNVLLHLGFVVVICASLFLVATQQYGMLQLYEGEIHRPAGPWLAREQGVLAEPMTLPFAVGLEQVVPTFWPNGELRQLASRIRIYDGPGGGVVRALAINQPLRVQGERIYQGGEHGNAFFVLFKGPGGQAWPAFFQIKQPAVPAPYAYGNFSVEGLPLLVKVKYRADAGRTGNDSADQRLAVRLYDGKTLLGETWLNKGQSGAIGPYTLSLVHVTRWGTLLFSRVRGMAWIFCGFLLIVVGAGLDYFCPPRECLVRKADGGALLHWRATRFPAFFAEEFDRLLAELRAGGNHVG